MRIRPMRTLATALLPMLTATLLAVPAHAGAEPGAQAYADLPPTHWAFQAVVELSGRHIISGLPDGTFQPDQAINRAQFLTMLLLTMGTDLHATTAPAAFTDVPDGQWYTATMNTAASLGLVAGAGGKARPLDAITRQEAAVVLHHAAVRSHLPGPGTEMADRPPFADQDTIAAWATWDVEQVNVLGLMHGDPDGKFQPLRNLTRAEAAVIMVQFLHAEPSGHQPNGFRQ